MVCQLSLHALEVNMDSKDFESERTHLLRSLGRKFGTLDAMSREDAAMVALERGWREHALGTHESFQEAHSWLFHIACNILIDILRHKELEPRLDDSIQVPQEAVEIARFEMDQTIDRLMHYLTEETREIFYLREIERRSLKEVAAITGLEPKTISQRCQRAIISLQKIVHIELDALQYAAHGTRNISKK
jgi:RNA polymerase sigma factor (sigma-70 family)